MDQGPQVDGHGHDEKREEEGWFPTFRITFIHCQGFILHLILFNSMFLKYKSVISSFHSYKLIKRGAKIGKFYQNIQFIFIIILFRSLVQAQVFLH